MYLLIQRNNCAQVGGTKMNESQFLILFILFYFVTVPDFKELSNQYCNFLI